MALRTYLHILFVCESPAQATAGAGFRDKTYRKYVDMIWPFSPASELGSLRREKDTTPKRNQSKLRMNGVAAERGYENEF